MTHNQIDFQRLQEEKRSNRAKETETAYHNRVTEAETERHQRADESIRSTTNLINAQHYAFSDTTTRDHYERMDSESIRHNLNTEAIETHKAESQRISAYAQMSQADSASRQAAAREVEVASNSRRNTVLNALSDAQTALAQSQQTLAETQTRTEWARADQLSAQTQTEKSQANWYDTQSKWKSVEAAGSLLRGVGAVLNPLSNVLSDVMKASKASKGVIDNEQNTQNFTERFWQTVDQWPTDEEGMYVN